MTTSILALAALFVCEQTSERKPHPLAPSLPLLSKEEYAEFERVIDRFVQYDIGKLKGEEGKKALADFKKLGTEAVFQLIEGFNKAANMEDSCPAVIIARKLGMIIRGTSDLELLAFLKETIGLEVTAKRHKNVIKDLQFAVQLQRAALQKQLVAGSGVKPFKQMSVAELAAAAAKEQGLGLKGAVSELGKRDGVQVVETLAIVAAKADADNRELAQKALVNNLARQKPDKLKPYLTHEKAQVRLALAMAIAVKRLPWGDELIGLLDDSEGKVRQAARQALVRISGGADYGPAPDANTEDRAEAVRRWRAWWALEKKSGKDKS